MDVDARVRGRRRRRQRLPRGTGLVLLLGAACAAPPDQRPSPSVAGAAQAQQRSSEPAAARPETVASSEAQPQSIQLPPGVLNLETARAIALQSNPDIAAATARLREASAKLEEAKARYLPTAEFAFGSFRATQIPESLSGVAGLISPGSASGLGGTLGVASLFDAFRGGAVEPFSEHALSFSGSWVVFDGFIREAAVQGGRSLEKAADYSLRDVQRLLVRGVDAAYYQVQFAGERLRIALSEEEFSREQFEVTEKLRDANRASMTDVQNFRVRMLAAQTEVMASRGMQEAGRVALAELMGLSEALLPEAITLEPLTEETPQLMAPPQVEASIASALSNRPDIRRLEHVVDAQAARIRAAKGEYLPSVVLGAAWGFDRTSNLKFSEDDQSSTAGVAMRWGLLSGGRRAKLHQAESQHAEAVANLSRARMAVVSEVRRAAIQVADTQQQIVLNREALAAAAENRRVVQAAYAAGRESLTRLNETQRDLVSVEAKLAVARIRLRQAWSELRAAVGTNEAAQEAVSEAPPAEIPPP